MRNRRIYVISRSRRAIGRSLVRVTIYRSRNNRSMTFTKLNSAWLLPVDTTALWQRSAIYRAALSVVSANSFAPIVQCDRSLVARTSDRHTAQRCRPIAEIRRSRATIHWRWCTYLAIVDRVSVFCRQSVVMRQLCYVLCGLIMSVQREAGSIVYRHPTML